MKSKMTCNLSVFNLTKQSLFFALALLLTFGANPALAKNFSHVSLNNQNIRPVELAQSAHISGSVVRKTTPHISGSIDLFRLDEKKEPLFGASEESNTSPQNPLVSSSIKESPLAKADRQTASAKNKLQSSQDRTTQRKTCWAQCETEFRSSIQEQCAEKSLMDRKKCRTQYFEKRMMCVRKTCQGM